MYLLSWNRKLWIRFGILHWYYIRLCVYCDWDSRLATPGPTQATDVVDIDVVAESKCTQVTQHYTVTTPQTKSNSHIDVINVSEWVRVSNRCIRAIVTMRRGPRCQLNKNDFSCRRNSPMSLSGWWILASRLFQSRGPAAAKLRSPSRVGPWNAARVDVGRS